MKPEASSGLASNSSRSSMRSAGTTRWGPDSTWTCETPSGAFTLAILDAGQGPSARLAQELIIPVADGRRLAHAKTCAVEFDLIVVAALPPCTSNDIREALVG